MKLSQVSINQTPSFRATFVNNKNFKTCLQTVKQLEKSDSYTHRVRAELFKNTLDFFRNDGTKDVIELKSYNFLNLFNEGNVIIRNGKTVFRCDGYAPNTEQFMSGLNEYARIVEFNNQFIPNSAQLKKDYQESPLFHGFSAIFKAPNLADKKLAQERFCVAVDNIERMKNDSFYQDIAKAIKEKYDIK